MGPGLRFVRNSPALKRVLQRVGLYVVFSSALWALLGRRASRDALGASGYVLLGSLGLGAVIGAVVMPRLGRAT